MSASRKSGKPLCRVPSSSPAPRNLRSLLGNQESIVGLPHDPKARPGGIAQRLGVEEETGSRGHCRGRRAASELMQLRQPETLRVLDHHHRRLGDVDADLDNGGRDQEIELAGAERRHDGILFAALHASMQQADAIAEAGLERLKSRLGGSDVQGFGLRHQRAPPSRPARRR